MLIALKIVNIYFLVPIKKSIKPSTLEKPYKIDLDIEFLIADCNVLSFRTCARMNTKIVPLKEAPKLVNRSVPIVGAATIEGSIIKALVIPIPKARPTFLKLFFSASITSVNKAPVAPIRHTTIISTKKPHKGR